MAWIRKNVLGSGREIYRLHIARTYTAFYSINKENMIVRVHDILRIELAHKIRAVLICEDEMISLNTVVPNLQQYRDITYIYLIKMRGAGVEPANACATGP